MHKRWRWVGVFSPELMLCVGHAHVGPLPRSWWVVAMPDGTVPEPGGWNRFSIEVADLEATVEALRREGAHFRNDVVTGVGGKQIILDDPSGNPVELFEPTRPEASLSRPAETG